MNIRTIACRATCLILFFCVGFVGLLAHDPIHEKIDEVSQRIKEDPTNPALYIERAGYHKIHQDFDKSFADYQTAKNLNPDLKTLDYLLAELFYAFEYPHAALASVRAFEKLGQEKGACTLFKAKIFDQMGLADSALFYAQASYPLQKKVSTPFFLLLKTYTLKADTADYEQAQYWLAEGKKQLPYDLVLQEARVDLAVKYHDYAEAVKLCEEQIPLLRRKEFWYFKLAGVYLEMKEFDKALENLDRAKDSVWALRPPHRNTTYIKNLSARIDEEIRKLSN